MSVSHTKCTNVETPQEHLPLWKVELIVLNKTNFWKSSSFDEVPKLMKADRGVAVDWRFCKSFILFATTKKLCCFHEKPDVRTRHSLELKADMHITQLTHIFHVVEQVVLHLISTYI